MNLSGMTLSNLDIVLWCEVRGMGLVVRYPWNN
jgi:hypothetical protein